MKTRQFLENRKAWQRQFNSDIAVVGLVADFAHQARSFRPLYETDHCVVALLEKLGQFRDGRRPAARKPCYAEKQLVLLRRKAVRAGRSFAEAHELPKLVPEIRHLAQAW